MECRSTDVQQLKLPWIDRISKSNSTRDRSEPSPHGASSATPSRVGPLGGGGLFCRGGCGCHYLALGNQSAGAQLPVMLSRLRSFETLRAA
jgi:hypothetical protein